MWCHSSCHRSAHHSPTRLPRLPHLPPLPPLFISRLPRLPHLPRLFPRPPHASYASAPRLCPLRLQALGLTDILSEFDSSPDVRVYSDLIDDYGHRLDDRQLERWLRNDVLLLGVAVLLIYSYMAFYFRNFVFALAAVMQIVLSFPVTFFLVDVVFRQRPVSAFAATSLWVVTGVSADNIFVVHETWKSANLLRVGNERAPIERRLRWTLSQSARPLIVADGTTAFALFINCLSSIDGVFQFGLCGGLLIITNFMLVLSYMPALLVLEERGGLGWGAP